MPYGITTEEKKKNNSTIVPNAQGETAGTAEESRQSAKPADELHSAQSGNNTVKAPQQSAQQTDTGVSDAAYEEAIAALTGAQGNTQPAMSDLDSQIADIYDKIVNRKPFSFDLDNDALYRQYADEYRRVGQLAMEDTMGQAAALTGGYGSTYAQNVGQQAYDGYLDRLNDIVPDIYAQRRSEYDAEGDELTNQYGLLADMRSDQRSVQQQNYEQLVSLIALGYKPTDEEIAAAGLTPEQIQTIIGAYGGGTGGTGSDSGSTAPDGTPAAEAQQMLRDLGYNIAVDGIWGSKSQAAWDDYMGKSDQNETPANGGSGYPPSILNNPQYKQAVQLIESGRGNEVQSYLYSTLKGNPTLYNYVTAALEDLYG